MYIAKLAKEIYNNNKYKILGIEYKADTLSELQNIMTPARNDGWQLISVFNDNTKIWIY